MPSKSYAHRKSPNRKYRSGSKFRTAKAMRRAGYVIGGFPKTKTIKLRYVQTIKLNASETVNGIYKFSANSMFDPDQTTLLAGHQPSNFDTWMSQYDHYCVQKSTISVQYIPVTATNVNPGALGILLSDGGTSVSDLGGLDAILEQPFNARAKQFVTGNNVGNPLAKATRSFNAASFFGKTRKVILGDDAYRGSVATNPADMAWFEIYYYAIGNNPGEITLIVTIDYEAVMSERRITLSS